LEAALSVHQRNQLEALVPLVSAASSVVIPHALFELTSKNRLVGLAAIELGDIEGGRELLHTALSEARNMRFRPEVALISLHLAELLLDHYPDERDAAIEHLDFAIAELRDMKMQPALERALGRRGLLKA
jgi:hypothetical protein